MNQHRTQAWSTRQIILLTYNSIIIFYISPNIKIFEKYFRLLQNSIKLNSPKYEQIHIFNLQYVCIDREKKFYTKSKSETCKQEEKTGDAKGMAF